MNLSNRLRLQFKLRFYFAPYFNKRTLNLSNKMDWFKSLERFLELSVLFFCNESDQRIQCEETLRASNRHWEFVGSDSSGFDTFQNHTRGTVITTKDIVHRAYLNNWN